MQIKKKDKVKMKMMTMELAAKEKKTRTKQNTGAGIFLDKFKMENKDQVANQFQRFIPP